MGLVFFVFGLNGFLHFIPQPPMEPGPAASFLGGLFSASYMLPLLKGTEVVAGALLLSNRFVPLALTLLAPIIVNIFLFHAVLAPSGVAVPVVIVILESVLAWKYRAAFRPMLAARAVPAAAEVDAAPQSGRVAA